MPAVARRRFLCLLAGGAGLAAASPWFRSAGRPPSLPDRNESGQELGTQTVHRVSRTDLALGSKVTITVLHADRTRATAALNAAFAELETVEQVMSIYRPASQLSQLNRLGVQEHPHPYLVTVLQAATAMSRRTQGAFDATVQPLWQTYWSAHENGSQLRVADLDAARKRVDWRRVEITAKGIRLRGPGTQVTLNGIAQGFAADRATVALQRHGIENALIDTGEFSSLGPGSDQDGWNVGIQHPRHPDSLIGVVDLAGRCLATSGDYATKFDQTFTTHHLLDPRTGRSATELASVSIVAATGLVADALSTAVFVLGLERGRDLLAETPGADALLVTKDGRSWTSPGFPLQETV